MCRCAVRLRTVWQSLEVADDRRDARLREIRAVREVVVRRVLVGRAGGRIRIGNLIGRRRDRIAVAVAPETGIAGAKHKVIGPCAALE